MRMARGTLPPERLILAPRFKYSEVIDLTSIPSLILLQHQQQVLQAIDRAKQVTMNELNAIIGVRNLIQPPLYHSNSTLMMYLVTTWKNQTVA